MKKYLTLSIVFFCFKVASCQHYLGLAPGNLAGTHSLYFNPSAIADTRQGFYLNLFSVNTFLNNNYARYKGDNKPLGIFSKVNGL